MIITLKEFNVLGCNSDVVFGDESVPSETVRSDSSNVQKDLNSSVKSILSTHIQTGLANLHVYIVTAVMVTQVCLYASVRNSVMP